MSFTNKVSNIIKTKIANNLISGFVNNAIGQPKKLAAKLANKSPLDLSKSIIEVSRQSALADIQNILNAVSKRNSTKATPEALAYLLPSYQTPFYSELGPIFYHKKIGLLNYSSREVHYVYTTQSTD